MTQPIVVRFTLDAAELISAIRAFKGHHHRRLYLLLGFLGVLFLALSAWLLARAPLEHPARNMTAITCGVATLIALLVLNDRVIGPRSALRQIGAARLPLDYNWRFGEEKIDFTCPLEEGKFDWRHWIKSLETRDYFFLYSTHLIFNVFPKKGFAGPEELAAFRELITRKFGVSNVG